MRPWSVSGDFNKTKKYPRKADVNGTNTYRTVSFHNNSDDASIKEIKLSASNNQFSLLVQFGNEELFEAFATHNNLSFSDIDSLTHTFSFNRDDLKNQFNKFLDQLRKTDSDFHIVQNEIMKLVNRINGVVSTRNQSDEHLINLFKVMLALCQLSLRRSIECGNGALIPYNNNRSLISYEEMDSEILLGIMRCLLSQLLMDLISRPDFLFSDLEDDFSYDYREPFDNRRHNYFRYDYTSSQAEEIKGKINGVWLTKPNGELHPEILPNFSELVTDVGSYDFEVVLWTNTDALRQSEIQRLTDKNIVVRDHKECSNSQFYPYFNFFLQKGIGGDKTAFALASDILRMCILELTPSDKYFIYIDPNDVKLIDLKNKIASMHHMMALNPFGFAFYIMPMFEDSYEHIQTRNDVLLALKSINPDFFSDYFRAYSSHLEKTHRRYFTPRTDGEAQFQANAITNSTGNKFFKLLLGGRMPMIFATFGDYREPFGIINVLALLPHERMIQNSNTWLPTGEFQEERAEIAEIKKKHGIREAIGEKSAMVETTKIFLCTAICTLFFAPRTSAIKYPMIEQPDSGYRPTSPALD